LAENFFHIHVHEKTRKEALRVLKSFMEGKKYNLTQEFTGKEIEKFEFKERKNQAIFIITQEHKSWTTIYGPMKENELLELALFISNKEKAKTLFLMLYEDDVFLYNLFKNGEMLAEYNSCPNYFEDRVTNRQIIESKEDSEIFLKEFPFTKEKKSLIKKMLTEGWVINQKDFERNSKYLDPGVLMNEFGQSLNIESKYLNINYMDFFADQDFLKKFPNYKNLKILIYKKKSYLWIWLLLLLFIFSGKLYQLIMSYF